MKRLCSLFFILIFLTLSGCTSNLTNSPPYLQIDKNTIIPEEMDNAISTYIIEKYKSIYLETEQQFEVHEVYGTSEKNGKISVYMWSYYGGFNMSSGTQIIAGHSLPVLIQLTKEGDTYNVIDYREPENGSYYKQSLEKMFPKKYVQAALNQPKNTDALRKEMDEKVTRWLEQEKE